MVEVTKLTKDKPIHKLWIGTRPMITFQKAEYLEV